MAESTDAGEQPEVRRGLMKPRGKQPDYRCSNVSVAWLKPMARSIDYAPLFPEKKERWDSFEVSYSAAASVIAPSALSFQNSRIAFS